MIAKAISRLRELKPLLEGRSVVAWAAIIGALLVSPSLFLGIQADDHYIRMAAHGAPGIPGIGNSWWRVFSFADGDPTHNAARIDWGLLPWWSAPEVALTFLRPLSSLWHALDYWYLEPHWWAMHVENIVLYAALCACVAMLYRRSGMTLWVAGLAALFYAADDAHGIAAGWLAGRNALLTTLFGVLTLLAHDTSRRNRSYRGAAGSVLAFVVGLGCGEAAVFVLGYLAAYAVILDEGRLRARAMSLAPYGVLFVVYIAFYASQGYGTRHSGQYGDPFGNPIGFARDVALNLPALIQAQFTIFSSNAYVVVPPQYHFVLHIFDFMMIALLLAAFAPLFRASKLARFWGLGMVLCTLPFCAAAPADRLLCPVGIGGMALVGHYLEFAFARWRELPTGARRRLERGMAIFLIFAHGVAGPMSLSVNSTSVRVFGRLVESGRARLPLDGSIANDSIIIVNPPVDVYAISMPTIQSGRRGPIPRHTWSLNAGIDGMEIRRTDEATLVVTIENGFFPKPFGVTFRGPSDTWKEGDTVRVADFVATVLSLTGDGRPRSIRFAFARPLEDPMFRWFYFGERNLEPFAPPGVGETTTIPAKGIIKGIRQMVKLATTPVG